ncbi:hypothetical protein F5B19DRAFT_280690 [Rostrohypoxylon terebratum]|nr:hypothetical protein F5B19DRAFT_280690 [Rostrohypoxylon terebratum]
MAHDYLCGLFCRRARPAPAPTRDSGLRGVEFSPRSSMASSIEARDPVPVASSSAQASSTTTILDNPEISGYYSPPAPTSTPQSDALREVRGYYAPEPASATVPVPFSTPRPNSHPRKTTYS